MARKKIHISDKKKNLTININKKLIDRIDLHNNETGEKRSRLISKLLLEYVEKNKDKISE